MDDMCLLVFNYVKNKCSGFVDLLNVTISNDKSDTFIFTFFPNRRESLKQSSVLAAIQMLGDDVSVSKITYNQPVPTNVTPIEDADSVIVKMFGFRYGEYCLLSYLDRQHYSSGQSAYFNRIIHFYDSNTKMEEDDKWWLNDDTQLFQPEIPLPSSSIEAPESDNIFKAVDLTIPFEMHIGQNKINHISQVHTPVQSLNPVVSHNVQLGRTKSGEKCYCFGISAGEDAYCGIVSSEAFSFEKTFTLSKRKKPDIFLHPIEKYVLCVLERHSQETRKAIGPFVLYANLMRAQRTASLNFMKRNCDKIAKKICDNFSELNMATVMQCVEEVCSGSVSLKRRATRKKNVNAKAIL